MKTTKHLWSIVCYALLLILFSCTEEEVQPPVEGTVTDKNGPITLELTKLTATTATFSGAVNLDLYAQYDEVGIIYSLSETLEIKPLVTTVVPITNIDKNNRYEKQMEDLLYDTKYYYSSYICMNGIYKYGEVQSFTTDDVKITVSEPEVTSTTAIFKGKVELDEEDMESLSFGVAWSKEKDFEKGVVEVMSEINEDGTFSVTVSGLKMDTEYYYATCVGQIDSEYGEVKAFSTASASMTVSATQITQTSVTFEGQAELSPADDSIEYGILYSIGDELEIGAEGCIRKKLTDIFDADGKYSLKVEGLVNDTKYNYCWYARQGDECKYGTAQEFTTASVTINLSVAPITQTTAIFKGSYEEPDGEGFEIGLIYSASSADLTTDSEAAKVIKLEDSAFSHKVDGLKYNTEYYYCIYICQDGDYKYGAAQSFKTQDVTVELSVNDITQTTATFTGKTVITESSAIEVGILYSTQSSLSMSSSSTKKKTLNNGDFSIKAEGLQNNTRYYYKYYIKQGDGYAYGETRDFTTTSISATLSKPVVTQTTATFSGNVNFDKTAPIEFGILYSTNNTLVVNTSGVKKMKATPEDNGDFSCKATGLDHSTTYYYCYYACQDGSYTYGVVSEVTTESVNISLSADSITQTTVTFNGNAELTESGVIEVRVLYSTDSELNAGAYNVIIRKLYPDSSGNMSIKIDGLHHNTDYFFCYCTYHKGTYTYTYGETQTFKTSDVSMTLSVDSVTQTTATFNGNVGLTEDGQIEVGVLYSTGNDLTMGASGVIKQVLTPDFSGNVSFKAEELQYCTDYYYCYYICQNGTYTYGTAQTFKTSDVLMTLSVDSITQTTATFNGNVELTEDGLIEVGVLYSTGNDLTIGTSGVIKQILTPDSSDNISGKAEGLQYGTTYNYCYYVYQSGKYAYGETQTFTTSSPSMTLSVDSITQTTATFSGNVELTEDCQIEVGVLYSTGNDLTIGARGVIKQVLTPDSSGNVSFKTEGLQHNTTYNYCYYVYQNGMYMCGDSQSFVTGAVHVNLSVNNLGKYSGNVELTEDGLIEVGVIYSTNNNLSVDTEGVSKHILLPDMTGRISFSAVGLSLSTKYYYCYYVCQNGIYSYGGHGDFTTLGSDDVDTNLSSQESANCYIVSQSGLYKIKTVKGNRSTSVGEITSSVVLWESFGTTVPPNIGELVSTVLCSKDYIVFDIPTYFREGNAVIAAKDKDNNILWSWHIWLTDMPKEQTYYNNAGTMMDRNLGATSATPGDIGSIGLLYQWGRKDPFLGSSSFTESIQAESTITWPSSVESTNSTGTIEYSISNPTTFIKGSINSSNDWYYFRYNKTRWDYEKTMYDPCPKGWKIPQGGSEGVWATACGSSSHDYQFDENNRGVNFGGVFGEDPMIWYPTSGSLYYKGEIINAGGVGEYWSFSSSDSSSFDGNGAYCFVVNLKGIVATSHDIQRVFGCSVRCVKE